MDSLGEEQSAQQTLLSTKARNVVGETRHREGVVLTDRENFRKKQTNKKKNTHARASAWAVVRSRGETHVV